MNGPPKTDAEELDFLLRAFQIARMLRLAADLGLADRIEPGARVALGELAQSCGAQPQPLLRVLRALAACDIFCVSPAGEVAHTPRSLLLRTDAPNSLHHAARFWTARGTWAAWGMLDVALTGGVPHEAAWGVGHFDYLRRHPDEARIFDAMMANFPDNRHAAFAAAYDFSHAELVIDIGGGHGATLRHVLQRFPRLRGRILDREDVVAALAPEDVLHGRITAQAGDFFDAVPGGGDIYLLIRILHNWDDEDCLRILRACRKSMGPDSTLLAGELILQPDPSRGRLNDYLVDVQMMAMYGRARERTESEFRALFEQAGLCVRQVIPTASHLSIIEAVAHPH